MSTTDSPTAAKAATDPTPRNWGWGKKLLVAAIGAAMLLFFLLIAGPFMSGLFDSFFGDSPVATTATRSCMAPSGITLSAVDPDGWVEWTDDLPGGDGSTTLILCDGDVARSYRIIGLVPGDPAENQAGLATDGNRRVVAEGRLRTLSPTLVQLSGLDLQIQCLPMWAGACDPA